MKYLVLILALAAWTGEASIVYRGRLYRTAKTEKDVLGPGDSYKMTFRLYTVANGGSPLCEVVADNVQLMTNGNFEVCLQGAAVDAALMNRAVYVGLSLDDARELIPRRQLLALPQAGHAAKADRFGLAPNVGFLAAGSASIVNSLTVDRLEVDGNLAATGNGQNSAAIGTVQVENTGVDLTHNRMRVFGKAKDVKSEADGRSWTAPADGVAYVYTKSSASNPKMGGTVRLCRKGDTVTLPFTAPENHTYGMRFYPFLSR